MNREYISSIRIEPPSSNNRIASLVNAFQKEKRLTSTDQAKDKLASIGLVRLEIPKDGSCLFRAVSKYLYGNQQHHLNVRRTCLNWISSNREFYTPFIESYGNSFERYIELMGKETQWGGNIEIQALSQCLKRNIAIHSFSNSEPNVVDNGFYDKKPIQLWFSHGNHYDLIYTQEEYKTLCMCQDLVYSIVNKSIGIPKKPSGELVYKNIELEEWKKQKIEQEKRDQLYALQILEKEKQGEYEIDQIVFEDNVRRDTVVEEEPTERKRKRTKSKSSTVSDVGADTIGITQDVNAEPKQKKGLFRKMLKLLRVGSNA